MEFRQILTEIQLSNVKRIHRFFLHWLQNSINYNGQKIITFFREDANQRMKW
jgi:hypothetical protein